jgi:hypothetical protein
VEATTQAPLTARGGGGFGRGWLVGETGEEDDSAVRMREDGARDWAGLSGLPF